MSATSSNSQTAKPEAQSTKPTEEPKSSLPSLGALDEDDEFEEFDEQGEHLCNPITSLSFIAQAYADRISFDTIAVAV